MKKIYYCVVIIITTIFIYYIVKYAPTVIQKFIVVTSHSISDSSSSTNGFWAFKSTLERSNLLNDYISINTDFLTNSPLPTFENGKDIKNFYELENFFTDFKYYYASKQKIYLAIFQELPLLFNSTKNLSTDELVIYFNNNKKYLNEIFGIENSNDFNDFITNLNLLKVSAISSYELENSYFYINSKNILNIRIILHLDNSEDIYIAAQIEPYNNNDYQSMPLIRFFAAPLLELDY